ncbi:GNAT family N-acetyltransferase [Nigerium massiliense]|uniref:GNAT family N-acetyltransferase n=1 Tax=Nigerium massiliense TaxID=1522317 RepID=UPI00058D2C7E|nr:GNAT family protein [Nigerium massiliense]
MADEPDLPLRTERLTLRAYESGDVDALLRYYGREDVARYLLDEPWQRPWAERQVARRLSQRHIANAGDAISLVVECDGRVIGDLSLWALDESLSHGEFGVVFDPDAGGKGFASEATAAVLTLAFDHYGMHRVQAQCDARNHASAALCGRLGMTHEAHLRQNWLSKGEWTDTLVYGVLAAEWAARTCPAGDSLPR